MPSVPQWPNPQNPSVAKQKKPGDSNALRESTLALALVIPDYRPDMLGNRQRQGQKWQGKHKKKRIALLVA